MHDPCLLHQRRPRDWRPPRLLLPLPVVESLHLPLELFPSLLMLTPPVLVILRCLLLLLLCLALLETPGRRRRRLVNAC